MKIIGLTGGIGTGKSTVSKILLSLGIPVVDADQISRSLLAMGSPYVDDLISLFGDWMIDSNGNVDRKILGAEIFKSTELRAQLEKFLHPIIQKEMHKQIDEYRKNGEKLIVLDIPLLFEGNYWQSQVDQVWLVDALEDIQLERIIKRDQTDSESARKRVEAQMSLAKKRQMADVIIDNNGGFDELEVKVKEIVSKRLKKRE